MCCPAYSSYSASRPSPFSYFSLFGLCFDQACRDKNILANCQAQAEEASTGNMEEDTAFVNDCVARAKGASSASSPDTLKQGLTVAQQILCIADPKNCPNQTTVSTPVVPTPTPEPAKFLGMPAPLGIGVALLGATLLIVGGIKLMKHKKVATA